MHFPFACPAATAASLEGVERAGQTLKRLSAILECENTHADEKASGIHRAIETVHNLAHGLVDHDAVKAIRAAVSHLHQITDNSLEGARDRIAHALGHLHLARDDLHHRLQTMIT